MVVICLLAFGGGKSIHAETNITVLVRPPEGVRNSHYVTNREPLQSGALVKLPVGAVKPQGWLKQTLLRQLQGLSGRLPEVSAWLQKDSNAWLAADGRGKWGWEEVPYWLRGAMLLAQLMEDQQLKDETEHWINAALSSQRSNGQFGPLRVFGDDDSPDLWANMVMLSCLQTYYEYSQDRRVLELMRNYFRYQATLPDSKMLTHFWQYYRGGDNLESVQWLFNITGEDWLLEVAEKVHRNTADWSKSGDLPSWHGVNIAQAFGEPATYYLQSGDPDHLKAAYENFRLVHERYGQFPGGMFAADENARVGYTDPRQAVETCAIVEQLRSDQQMLAITGDSLWADHIEEVAFNTLPAACAPDYRSLRYLIGVNHISSDSKDYAPGIENVGPMFTYNPLSHRCCQHNHTQGWPRLVEHLWMATQDNGICAACYGPSVVEAIVGEGSKVRIEETTRYPFEEQIMLDITPELDTRFPLYLRIPAWSERSDIAINGSVIAEDVAPSTYVRIERVWKRGDQVLIRLPMDVRVQRWPANQNCVSVSRGPITYSLRIESKRIEVDPTKTVAIDSAWKEGVDQEAWPAHELEAQVRWNYGLLLDDTSAPANFKVVHKGWPESDYPFSMEDSPIELLCLGREIPEWKRDLTGLCGRLQHSPAYSEMPNEQLRLIPMGAAQLRISAFPEVSDDRRHAKWRTVENAVLKYQPSSSYCAKSDSIEAMADGLLPCASSDQGIPRLTFLPRKGSEEWVQADFKKPISVNEVSIFWSDDTSRYDHAPTGPYGRAVKDVSCKAPESWRLYYWGGDAWLPVKVRSTYGVSTNRFNTVQFEEVVTRSLRAEIKLLEGASAGILEWRIGKAEAGESHSADRKGNAREVALREGAKPIDLGAKQFTSQFSGKQP